MPQPQPQLIEVDPQRVKFNPENPRIHGGSDYLTLKKSIQEVGHVLVPIIIRVKPGGFYETIDGESRTRVAQEIGLESIPALNFGMVDDIEALTFLQVSNVVRSFNFLAQCKGFAALHKRGLSAERIARRVGERTDYLQDKIAIGYFPDAIFASLEKDIAQSEERAKLWSIPLLIKLLPLRQILPGQMPPGYIRPGHGGHGTISTEPAAQIEGVYDYAEVQRAVEQIITDAISTPDQLSAYVEQRRRELFEQRFNEEMRLRLETELAQTKRALEEAHSQQLQHLAEQTAEQAEAKATALQQRYEAQVNVLRQQYEDLEKQYKKLVTDVAKRPEIIAQREEELKRKLTAAERERERFQSLQQQVQSEIQTARQQAQQEAQKAQEEARTLIQRELSDAIKEQRKAMDSQLAQARADMEAYYAQKDQQRQLKAESSVRQTVAHGTELLTQTQQSFLLLTTPDFLRGIAWLPETEVGGLLAQIMAVQDTLSKALDAIRHGYAVESQERVIATNG